MNTNTYTVYDVYYSQADTKEEAIKEYNKAHNLTPDHRPRVQDGDVELVPITRNPLQTLQEGAMEELEDAIKEYIADNPDETPETIESELYDRMHEVADNWTPIYNYHIKEIIFMDGQEVMDAWEAHHGGELPNDQSYPFNFMPAIYYAICEHLAENILDAINTALQHTNQ